MKVHQNWQNKFSELERFNSIFFSKRYIFEQFVAKKIINKPQFWKKKSLGSESPLVHQIALLWKSKEATAIWIKLKNSFLRGRHILQSACGEGCREKPKQKQNKSQIQIATLRNVSTGNVIKQITPANDRLVFANEL